MSAISRFSTQELTPLRKSNDAGFLGKFQPRFIFTSKVGVFDMPPISRQISENPHDQPSRSAFPRSGFSCLRKALLVVDESTLGSRPQIEESKRKT